MRIRKTEMSELEILLKLYENARKFMAEHGNEAQWGSTYPERELVEADIRSGCSYVCVDDEDSEGSDGSEDSGNIDGGGDSDGGENGGRIAATFFFSTAHDPCYQSIEGGQWLNDAPYGVVHRITSDGKTRGTASFCLAWALAQCGNLKIDTHRDNHVMQNMLAKNGFTYCGIVHMEDGTERMAYQKSI